MLIASPCVVALTWTLTDAQNHPIHLLVGPTDFMLGGHDLLAGVEDAATWQRCEAAAGMVAGAAAPTPYYTEHAYFGSVGQQRACF